MPHAGFTSETNFTLQRTRPKPDFSTTEQLAGNQHRNLTHLAVQSTLELRISLCSDPKIIITTHSTPTQPTSACFWDQKGKFPSSKPTPKPTQHSIINPSTKFNYGKATIPRPTLIDSNTLTTALVICWFGFYLSISISAPLDTGQEELLGHGC